MRRKAGAKACLHAACYRCSYQASKTDTRPHSPTQNLQLIPSCLPLSVLPNKKDEREESRLNGKLEGPAESQRETHKHLQARRNQLWASGSGVEGKNTALLPSLWSEAQAICTEPQRGACLHTPSIPKGLANGTDASSEERKELPRCISYSTTVIVRRIIKKVITLFDLVSADQSKQNTI